MIKNEESKIIEIPDFDFHDTLEVKSKKAREFIENTLDNAQDDNSFKILVESEIQPEVMPSMPTFEDMFKLTIENINIHYHYPEFWKYFLLEGPSRKIKGDILIRLRTEPDDNYNCIWRKYSVDLNKQLRYKNWNKLRKEISEYTTNYYEKTQKNYRRELRDWYNKRKDNKLKIKENVKNN